MSAVAAAIRRSTGPRLDPSCTITGVDISEPMLALAEDLKPANQSSLQADVSFVLGDASEPSSSRDVLRRDLFPIWGHVFCRPNGSLRPTAFTLKPSGQLGFVCWQSPAPNPFGRSHAGGAYRLATPPRRSPERPALWFIGQGRTTAFSGRQVLRGDY